MQKVEQMAETIKTFQVAQIGDEGARQKKKSALSDAWDNDGWETLNKDD
jgi:hypothetical protein